MKVTVQYLAQLKQAAGAGSEEVVLSNPCSPLDLVRQLADRHGETLKNMLLQKNGNLRPTILLFVNERQLDANLEKELQDGDEVTLLSPIAGGASAT